MVYGNIVFDSNRTSHVNIGDDLQLIAIEYLYNSIGIDYNSVVRIGLSELSSYRGEYMVLPISFPLYGYQNGLSITSFSPYIIPVFLGLSLQDKNISPEDKEYFKRFEPIGCRDYYTVSILRENGILSYMGGCISLTLPNLPRENPQKIYFVDVPCSYYQYIPNHIKADAVITSQVLPQCDNPEEEMKNRLSEYANNARMVVTTRLHCALPCIAMGIPVVFMKDRYSFRFSTLSKYIHPYTNEEFHSIDWNPKPVIYDKDKIIAHAKQRILNSFEYFSSFLDISWYYEHDNLREDYYIEYVDDVIEDIHEIFPSGQKFEYAIWGITQPADMICSYIEKNYPQAVLSAVYDRSKKVKFHGTMSTSDIEVLKQPGVFVLVTAATANEPAKKLFDSINKTNYLTKNDGLEGVF